jgi:hypothetical protein
MTTYLANSFSPSMLPLPADVAFQQIDKKEFCEGITNGVVNSVGHRGTIDLINMLCGTSLTLNRVSVRATVGDVVYILTLALRLEEGKVLTSKEVAEIYEEGKVLLLRAKVYAPVLEELTNCEGICNEMAYDALAHKAKLG